MERDVPAPSGREILIKIHASAVNRADTLQRKGQYPPPPGATDVLGLEAAGEVVSTGPDVEGTWVPGQRVMTILASGGYGESVVVDERQVMPAPARLDIRTAAALPETWLTAFQLLRLVGEATPGEHVLVHAAGSGVGIAATQLATAMGLKVIAVAGSDEKLETSKALGASAVINYKTTPNFGEAVRAATGGNGVNLVLDPVGGGPHMEQNCTALASEGRWVLYGLMGGVSPAMSLLPTILGKRLVIKGTTLRARSVEYKGALVREFSDFALAKFEDGSFQVKVDKSFPLAEADAAHEYMLTDASNGKIVLVVKENSSL